LITATDLAGNSASLEIELSWSVLPPPLFFLDAVEKPLNSIDELITTAAPEFDVLVDEGAVLHRRTILNPNPVAAKVTLMAGPLEDVALSHARTYVEPTVPLEGTCATGQCRYELDDGELVDCTAPIHFEEEVYFQDDSLPTLLKLRETSSDEQVELAVGAAALLPPLSKFHVDVTTLYGEAGIAVAGVQPVIDLEGAAAQAVLLDESTWYGSCNWSAGFPPSPTRYDIPDVLTAFSTLPADSDVHLAVQAPGGTQSRQDHFQMAWKFTYYVAPFEIATSPTQK